MKSEFYFVRDSRVSIARLTGSEDNACEPCSNAGFESRGQHFLLSANYATIDGNCFTWQTNGSPTEICSECLYADGGVLVDADRIEDVISLCQQWDQKEIELRNVPTDHGAVAALSISDLRTKARR